LLLFIAEIQGILYLPKRDHIFWPILYFELLEIAISIKFWLTATLHTTLDSIQK